MNALVGSLGLSVSAAGASLTPAWGVGANRTAGDVLRCSVICYNHSTLPATPAGWDVVNQVTYGSPSYKSVSLFTRVATGADAAPVIAANADCIWIATLAEYAADPTGQQELAAAVGQPVNVGDQVAVYPAPSVVKTVRPDGSIS